VNIITRFREEVSALVLEMSKQSAAQDGATAAAVGASPPSPASDDADVQLG